MQVNDYDLSILNPRRRKGLGKRELEIFILFGRGLGTQEVALLLDLSRRTVQSHRDHIKAKLGITSLIQLYQLAYRYVQEAPKL